MSPVSELSGSVQDARDCSFDLGPKTKDFFRTCVFPPAHGVEESPHRTYERHLFLAAIVGAAVLTGVNLYIGGKHRRAIRAAPVSVRSGLYLDVARMPLVFGLTSFCAVISPRGITLWELVQKGYEAYTLQSFGRVLLNLLAVEHMSERRSAWAAAPGTEPLLSSGGGRGIADSVVKGFEKEGAKKYWATPPCGCCWTKCMPLRVFSTRDMVWVIFCLRQFVFAVPLFAVAHSWTVLDHSAGGMQETISKFCDIGTMVSSMVALQGLFVLYKATHDVLHHWSTTAKFVSIKVVLALEIWQKFIIVSLVHHREKQSWFHDAAGCQLQGDHRVHYWCMWWLVPEAVLMAWLMSKAFPAEELSGGLQIGELDKGELDALIDLSETTLLKYEEQQTMKAAP